MKKSTVLFIGLGLSAFSLNAQQSLSGIINTVAGRAGVGYNGDNIQATAADLNQDGGVVVDINGNIYIADSQNNRVRKITSGGVITTIAGNGFAGYSGDGAQATAAELNYPDGVRVDTLGNIYISDANNAIVRRVSSGGIINTIAGRPGFAGYTGDGGRAVNAELNYPVGLCIDKNLNIYIADGGANVIRKIAAGTTGTISTVAGTGAAGFSGDGAAATLAHLSGPTGVAIDASGNLYIADLNNSEVRKVTTGGIISDYAGNHVNNFNFFSGAPTSVEIAGPSGISIDGSGNIYISDAGNAVVWAVSATNGQIYAIAGTVDATFGGDNGPAYLAEVNYPFDVYPDRNHNIFIADLGNNRVRKIVQGCTGDSATAVSYNYPECHGGTDGIIVAFPVSPFAPYTYSWSNGSTVDSLNVPAGTYTVTITDGFGCNGTGDVVITQPAPININLSANPDTNICLNSQVLLTATASGGVGALTFVWDATGTTQDTLTVGPTSSQAFEIFVNDVNGCYDSTSINININPLPNVILNAETYSVCNTDTSDTLAGSPAGGIYSGPNLSGNVFNPSAAGAGTYTFTYTFTDSAGCSNVANQSVIVNICTGIPGIANGARIAVYPNPATDEFTIQLVSNDAAQMVEMYSITGQQVYEHNYTSSENSQLSTISTEGLPTGVYVLKVLLHDGTTLVQRVDVVR